MQRIIFCLICALLLVKPTSNSLFLNILGIDFLPWAYLLVSVVALFISLFYNKYVDVFAPKKLFVISSTVSVVMLLLLSYFLYFNIQQQVCVFIFYLFVSVFGILSASQFWIMFNQLFNARQARKYFAVIGTGAITGGIAGGYLASIITKISATELILVVAALFIMVAIIETQQLRHVPNIISTKQNSSETSSILRPFFLIKNTRHLKLFAIIVAISVFVAKLIDYQFGYFATLAFPVEEDLTAFYGFWYSSFNLMALLLQLFVTNKIVGRFGVAYSILILPILIIMGSAILIIIPIIALALILKLFDASLKQSINKASFELIMLPIPEDIKLKTKTFIDLFVDSLATGISGIAIIFFINTFDLPNAVITGLILVSTVLWFHYANVIRKEYKRVFRNSLKIKSSSQFELDRKVLEQYEDILLNGNDFQRLKTLALLKQTEFVLKKEVVLHLLQDKNPKIVEEIIHHIIFMKEDFAKEIKTLLTHPNQSVRSAAFGYLINHQDDLETHFLLKYLESKDYDQLIMAISAYTKEFGNNKTILKVLDIEKRIGNIVEEYKTDNAILKPYHLTGLASSIASAKFKSSYSFIEGLLDHPEKEIRNKALLEAGRTHSKKFFNILTRLLLDANYQNESLYKALSFFGLTEIKNLERQLNTDKNYPVLRQLPFVYSHIFKQESVAGLESMLRHRDIKLRNNAIRALSDLINKYPLLKTNDSTLSLILIEEAKYNNAILKILLDLLQHKQDSAETIKLIEVLKEKIDVNLKVIFNLLDIIYPPEDYMELYEYVQGTDVELRNNAIEYLDNSLHTNLKSILIPMIEYQFNKVSIKPEDLEIDDVEIKNFLLTNRDEEIKMAAHDFYRQKT